MARMPVNLKRSESLKSERSDASQKRVSFNKSVHVKHIPKGAVVDSRGRVVAVIPEGVDSHHYFRVARAEPSLSPEEVAREAAAVLRQVDQISCSASPSPFPTHPHTIERSDSRAKKRPPPRIPDSSEHSTGSRTLPTVALRNKINRGSHHHNHQQPPQQTDYGNGGSLEPILETSHQVNSPPSAPSQNQNFYHRPRRKQAPPEPEKMERNLSPLRQFHQHQTLAQQNNHVNALVQRFNDEARKRDLVRRDMESAGLNPLSQRSLSPERLIQANGQHSHNKNRPFSYLQPNLASLSPGEETPPSSPTSSALRSPHEVIYAQVTVNGQKKSTVHKRLPDASTGTESQEDDERIGLSKSSYIKHHPTYSDMKIQEKQRGSEYRAGRYMNGKYRDYLDSSPDRSSEGEKPRISSRGSSPDQRITSQNIYSSRTQYKIPPVGMNRRDRDSSSSPERPREIRGGYGNAPKVPPSKSNRPLYNDYATPVKNPQEERRKNISRVVVNGYDEPSNIPVRPQRKRSPKGPEPYFYANAINKESADVNNKRLTSTSAYSEVKRKNELNKIHENKNRAGPPNHMIGNRAVERKSSLKKEKGHHGAVFNTLERIKGKFRKPVAEVRPEKKVNHVVSSSVSPQQAKLASAELVKKATEAKERERRVGSPSGSSKKHSRKIKITFEHNPTRSDSDIENLRGFVEYKGPEVSNEEHVVKIEIRGDEHDQGNARHGHVPTDPRISRSREQFLNAFLGPPPPQVTREDPSEVAKVKALTLTAAQAHDSDDYQLSQDSQALWSSPDEEDLPQRHRRSQHPHQQPQKMPRRTTPHARPRYGSREAVGLDYRRELASSDGASDTNCGSSNGLKKSRSRSLGRDLHYASSSAPLGHRTRSEEPAHYASATLEHKPRKPGRSSESASGRGRYLQGGESSSSERSGARPRPEKVKRSRSSAASLQHSNPNLVRPSRGGGVAHRRPGPGNVGEGSSESEQGSQLSRPSGSQSSRSVYLHAAAVADIPPGGAFRGRNGGDGGTMSRSQEDLWDRPGGLKKTKAVTRSLSLLAPWKPRHYRETKEVDYSSPSPGEGRPPRPPRKKENHPVTPRTVNVKRHQSMPKDSRLAGWFRKRDRGEPHPNL
ncbi:unnamed protein product [Darwinula stevensoni]|uniref:Uncharacterized protein n=1 Tax=Darwinula stevensoni TaxID=69355 RepID=A0A7R8X4H4_9CRUS|nr:unnamed protein product [Darwinula stevensoni]CAG0879010.1 unnamed protein product [Darwinula stevensoni]